MVAAPALAQVVARAHQFLTFLDGSEPPGCCRVGLSEGNAWLQPMRESFRLRDLMAEGLKAGAVLRW